MPAERYYIPQVLQNEDTISLTDAEFHHLTNVMRGKAGDTIELVNGRGDLATAKISSVEKKKAIITVSSVEHIQQPTATIILAQAIPRLNRLDFIIEKATELGITTLWLFPGDRSERKELTEHQIERCKAIAIGAMKQSGRIHLPEIILKPPLSKWKEPSGALLYGDVSPKAPLLKDRLNASSSLKTTFFIGPESGFSPSETNLLIGWGSQGVSLNRNILRTDTAALSAVTLLSHHLVTDYS